MITLYNVTEARAKLSQIGNKLKNGNAAAFLKNGKILFVAIGSEEFKQYQKFQEEQKTKIWSENLPHMEISKEEAKSVAEARNEIAREDNFIQMSAKEFMNTL